MNPTVGSYHLVDLPPERHIMLNILDLSWRSHTMVGLLEVDVTVPRRLIAEHQARAGERLSFTGFLAFCLARAVQENKSVQACLKGRRQLILFEDVHVGIMVEGRVDGKRELTGYVIRDAHRKSFLQIHQEIRSVQANPLPFRKGMPAWFRAALLLPPPLSSLFKALVSAVMRQDPTIAVAIRGSVGISSVGMFGQGHSGWGLAPTNQSLSLIVGSTAWKPAVVNGAIEPRQILHLTVLFDHDIVDGAPAARFTQRLVELIENGHGLVDDPPTASPDSP